MPLTWIKSRILQECVHGNVNAVLPPFKCLRFLTGVEKLALSTAANFGTLVIIHHISMQ